MLPHQSTSIHSCVPWFMNGIALVGRRSWIARAKMHLNFIRCISCVLKIGWVYKRSIERTLHHSLMLAAKRKAITSNNTTEYITTTLNKSVCTGGAKRVNIHNSYMRKPNDKCYSIEDVSFSVRKMYNQITVNSCWPFNWVGESIISVAIHNWLQPKAQASSTLFAFSRFD